MAGRIVVPESVAEKNEHSEITSLDEEKYGDYTDFAVPYLPANECAVVREIEMPQEIREPGAMIARKRNDDASDKRMKRGIVSAVPLGGLKTKDGVKIELGMEVCWFDQSGRPARMPDNRLYLWLGIGEICGVRIVDGWGVGK